VSVPAVLAAIPSPTTSIWHLGPLPLRAYALCILLGVVVAVVLTERRLRARGAPRGLAADVAVWAVPAGIVGARLYHVVTTPRPYFGEGGDPLAALQVWNGGLGIWGGVLGGALGAWVACRRRGMPLSAFGDAVAPGLLLAQAVGRLGNWFNNELYGRATDLPWALRVYDMDTRTGRAVEIGGDPVVVGTFHPTFLYESLWCLGAAAVVVLAERRWHLGRGRVFALYCMLYTAGRAWVEALRVDEAERILGLRLNLWTCLVVFLGALVWFLTHPGPPDRLATDPHGDVVVLPAAASDVPDGARPSGGDPDRPVDADDPPRSRAG